jgi:hypothetical protein
VGTSYGQAKEKVVAMQEERARKKAEKREARGEGSET